MKIFDQIDLLLKKRCNGAWYKYELHKSTAIKNCYYCYICKQEMYQHYPSSGPHILISHGLEHCKDSKLAGFM